MPQFDVRTLAEEIDGALAQERLIATLSTLFGGLALGPTDLFAFAAATLVLAAVAAAAVFLPARRPAGVNPTVALRAD